MLTTTLGLSMHRRSYLAMAVPIVAGCTSIPSSQSDSPTDSDDSSNEPSDPLSIGDESVTDTGVRVGLEEVVVSDSYETIRSEFPRRIGQLFVFVEIAVEYVGDAPRSVSGPDALRLVADGDQFEPISTFSGEPFTDPVGGGWYDGIDDARSGVGDSGWLVFQVPRSVSTAVLSWHEGSVDAEEIRWKLDLADEIAELPDIQFAGISAPETATAGERIDLEIAITNEGGSDATIDLHVWVEGLLDDEREWEVTVPAGETVSQPLSYTFESAGELVVHVDEFGVSEHIVVEPGPE